MGEPSVRSCVSGLGFFDGAQGGGVLGGELGEESTDAGIVLHKAAQRLGHVRQRILGIGVVGFGEGFTGNDVLRNKVSCRLQVADMPIDGHLAHVQVFR